MPSYILLNSGNHIGLNAGGAVLLNAQDAEVEATAPLSPGGITKHRERRRILMPDGRILIPADDQEYRRAVEQIVAGFGQKAPEPSRKARKRLSRAVIHPEKVQPVTPVRTLPSDFYTALEFNRAGVLNYLAIQSAYRAWLEEQDEDEALTLLLLN